MTSGKRILELSIASLGLVCSILTFLTLISFDSGTKVLSALSFRGTVPYILAGSAIVSLFLNRKQKTLLIGLCIFATSFMVGFSSKLVSSVPGIVGGISLWWVLGAFLLGSLCMFVGFLINILRILSQKPVKS